MKLLILVLLALSAIYRLTLNIVQYRSAGNPIPENVADVYDGEEYSKWRRYSAETCRLDIISTILSFVVSLVLPKERSIQNEMECNTEGQSNGEIPAVQHFRVPRLSCSGGKALRKALSQGAVFERA